MKLAVIFSVSVVISLFFIPLVSHSQSEFEQFNLEQAQALEKFNRQDSLAYANYIADIEKKWREFRQSNQQTWVTYGKDGDTRADVDFKEGVIEVEAIVPKADPEALKDAKLKIGEHIAELLKMPSQGSDLLPTVEQFFSPTPEQAPSPTSRDLALEGMLETNQHEAVSPSNADQFSRDVSEQAQISGEPITGADGVERVKITVQVKMVPDHLRRRAEQYLPIVREQCRHFELDVPLIMAVIHTESFFNPKAKSSAPAYGLMQLVPHSGGREAYKFARGQDVNPSVRFLYDPRNNIELGTAYLKKLQSNEFKGISNPQSATYCMISAYNTGPSNVARGLTKGTNVGKVADLANGISPEELYKKLRKKLPYKETRDYLEKVTSRTELYLEWR